MRLAIYLVCYQYTSTNSIRKYNHGVFERETHIGGLFVVVYIVHVSGETKVGDLHDIVLRHEDVSGSQVSVDTLTQEEQTHQTPSCNFSHHLCNFFMTQHHSGCFCFRNIHGETCGIVF